MSVFAKAIMDQKYSHTKPDGTKETWPEIASRVAENVLAAVNAPQELVDKTKKFISERKFMAGGRYNYAAGRDFHQVQNCLLLRAEDSREGWADLMQKGTLALMTGAGIGVDYSGVRAEGKLIRRTGGQSTGPLALMQMVNEAGRFIMQGGARRSAIWAGLNWKHPDIHKFIRIKNWSPEVKALKAKDFNFPAPMDGTNVSVLLDDEFFVAYHDENHVLHAHAQSVYWATVEQMLSTAEPGFSVDVGPNAGETLRNACTEVCSFDDSDICNLGSINLARIESIEEMAEVVEIATAFLLAGTVYSHVPYEKVDRIRTKNRRLGLGVMGVHEFLLQRGKKYGPDAELGRYLEVYATSTEIAKKYAQEWGLSAPVKTRAIAPNGTIGIIAETTTSGEPVFGVALKRRYLKGKTWNYQYIIDPTAERLIEAGVDPDQIEDAYVLAEDVERRVAMQAWLQKYVDHAISSTINLPAWGTEFNNKDGVRPFGDMLIRYLAGLRGITAYPDGARGGQPLTTVKYATAKKHIGEVFEEAPEPEITHAPELPPEIHEEPTMADLFASDFDDLQLSDTEAAMPVDVCGVTKGGSCGT
jgi:ribonucleoside-diphosphate reductase alpha chain